MAFDSISPFNMNSKNNDNDNNVSSRQITIDSDSNSNAYGSLTPPLQAAELWRMQQAREEENNSLLQLLSNRQNARQQQSSGSGMPSFNSTNNNTDDPSPSGQQNGGHANGTSFPPSSSLSSSSVNNITTAAAGMMSNYAAARQSLMNDMNNVRGGGVSSGGLGMDHMNMSNNNSNIPNNPFDMNPISLASMRRGMGGTGTGQGGSLGPSSAFTMSSFMNSRLGCDQAMMNGFGGGDSSGDNDNMDNNRGQNNSNINSMNYNDMISGSNGMSGVGSSIGQQQQQHQQQQQQPSLSDYINNSSLNSDNLPNFETHMNHPFGASGYGGGGLSSSNNLNNNNNINNNMNSFRSSMTSISPGFQSEFLLQQQILHGGGPSSIASSNNMAGSLRSLSSGPDNLSYLSSMTGCGLSSGGGFPQEDQGWEDQFKNLRAYQMQFGHCRVPARYKADQKLGRWVMTQRRQFTLLMQGFPSALTTDRIKRLENLGFTWSVRPEPVTTWNSKFQELKAYKATYGNCMVPQRYQANPKLGTWVHTQRRQYKLLAEGKKSSMTKDKAKALESIGFFWAAKASSSITSTANDSLGRDKMVHTVNEVVNEEPPQKDGGVASEDSDGDSDKSTLEEIKS